MTATTALKQDSTKEANPLTLSVVGMVVREDLNMGMNGNPESRRNRSTILDLRIEEGMKKKVTTSLVQTMAQ
jgi:hypothetical protein